MQPTSDSPLSTTLNSTTRNTDSRVRIVEALWVLPGQSRIELAETLGMDKSTMSRGVARLMESGLIRETETRDSGPLGGRRRVGLEIDGSWGAWLGLELQPDSCRGILVDFSGRPLSDFLFRIAVDGRNLEAVLKRAGEEAAVRAESSGTPIIAAGLAVPGPVRPGTAVVERSRPLGIIRPTDLAARGCSVLNMPVSADNDVSCGCRAEMHFNDRDTAPNFLYLLAEAREGGLSLGLGTVIGGIPHRGDHGAGGEILSVYRTEGSDQLALDVSLIARAGRDGEALKAVAEELAPQIAMLANVLDIDRLILGGLFREHYDKVAPVFSDALIRRRTYPDLAGPELIPSSRGDEAVAYGAAIHFTENLSQQEFWRNL